jgi:iron complex outermembrane receptor protein
VFKTEAVSDSSYLATELGFTPPAALAKSISSPNSGSFAEELRLTSAPGRLEWILGGFYTDQNGQQPYLIRGSDSSGNLLPPSNPFFNVYTYSSYPSYFERAIFGDITYHFTDQIQATVGSRYSAINQDVRTITSGLLGVNDLNNPSHEKKITYLATVTYKPVQDLSIYARAGSAYRPGGANILNVVETAAGAASTYNADTLWNYEIGVKGTAWDQRLRYSADLFHMYWHDIQTSESIHGFSVITNAGGATSDGIEFALEALPIEGLTAEIKGAFMKTEYTTDVPCGKGCDPTPRGTPLPYSPHFTGTLNLDYDFEPYHEFTPTVGLTYSYHGSVFTPLSNFTSYAIPSYDTLDLRAGVTWAQYSIIGRINNIADTFGLTSAYAGAGTLENLAGGTVIQPRTFSLSFEAHF